MSINLSQLKVDKIKVTIPLYLNGEFVDNIEIYNPNNELVDKIKEHIVNQTYNDIEFKNELLRELTNINVDCELDDFYVSYYSDIFAQVMMEIDDIIFEILTNYMVELDKLSNLSEGKLGVFNSIVSKAEEEYKNVNNELQAIEETKEKKRKEKELIRQVEEANIKLQELKGDKNA